MLCDDSFVPLVVIAGRADEDMGAVGKKLHTGISASIIAELTDCNAALSQQRKKRQVFFALIYNLAIHGKSFGVFYYETQL